MPKGHSPKVIQHHTSTGNKGIVGSSNTGGSVTQKFGINGFTSNGKLHHGNNSTTSAQSGFGPRTTVVTSGSKMNS